ncbi:hypothetical protein [Bartonella tamiae]|uniref:DUF1269 domain-containing protein n=1 Tax=Bartonella tamiae Th239 TaxID=1094558 RepID=J1K0U3_9HYPH|nr:hypothetical protein [Bartonella tamiae]EJF91047.1 hypothetical protein ME5_00379 [Bartonella tamiae Th239]EJF93288.1 hypothetical protein MEG_01502 [Bartonella tamiae Th307]
MQIVNALFDDRFEAEKAFAALIANKCKQSDISFITQNNDKKASELLVEGDKTHGVLKGAIIGVFAGIAGGLALMSIPAVTPVDTLGWLAAIFGGGAAGGALGAFAGNMSEVMSKAGVDQNQAQFYRDAVTKGSTLLVLRVPDEKANDLRAVLDNYNYVDPDQSNLNRHVYNHQIQKNRTQNNSYVGEKHVIESKTGKSRNDTIYHKREYQSLRKAHDWSQDPAWNVPKRQGYENKVYPENKSVNTSYTNANDNRKRFFDAF